MLSKELHMSILNTFLLNLDHGLSKYPSDQKERIRHRVLDNLKKDNILHPIYDILFYDPLDEEEISVSELREEKVKTKQQELRIPVEESKTKFKYGRTHLHEAVVISDFELLKKLLSENNNVHAKDNNGNTPIDHAILDENKEALRIFKDFGHSV